MSYPAQKSTPAASAEHLAADIRSALDRPIALVGMMGAGKSKLGRMLAKALDLPFLDTDTEVEKSAGCTTAQIFERYGESAFRQAETKIVKRLIGEGISVIATGGGAVMNPDIDDLVADQTLSLWVRADLDLMLARTSRTDTRPLLKTGDPRVLLEKMMVERYPIYEKANAVVDSHDGPATETLYAALVKLDAHLKDHGFSR